MDAMQRAADLAREEAIRLRQHAEAADRRAADIEANLVFLSACEHEFEDWSNAIVPNFHVCRHCGLVRDADGLHMGRTVTEFREYMAKNRKE